MNKKLIWGLIIAVIVIVLIVLGVSNNKPNAEGLDKVGIISILSGEYATVGQEVTNGAILASEIYNKENPENQIELIIEDDGFDSKKALSAYKKLTGIDNIDALINVSTPSIGAIYDLVQSDDKVVLQMGEQPTEPEDDLVYGLFPGSIEAEIELGEYLKNQGYKNPLVAYTIHDTMIRFKNALVSGYGEGIEEIGIPADEKDMRTHVLKASEGDYDVIAILMFPQPGAQFISQFSKQGITMPKLAFDASVQTGFADYKRILGDTSILNGSIVATLAQKTSEDFINLYTERFGNPPGFLADMGYDAFNLLIEVYDENPKKWKENIQNISYEGANGLYKFNDVGIRLPDTVITSIENGEIVIKN